MENRARRWRRSKVPNETARFILLLCRVLPAKSSTNVHTYRTRPTGVPGARFHSVVHPSADKRDRASRPRRRLLEIIKSQVRARKTGETRRGARTIHIRRKSKGVSAHVTPTPSTNRPWISLCTSANENEQAKPHPIPSKSAR